MTPELLRTMPHYALTYEVDLASLELLKQEKPATEAEVAVHYRTILFFLNETPISRRFLAAEVREKVGEIWNRSKEALIWIEKKKRVVKLKSGIALLDGSSNGYLSPGYGRSVLNLRIDQRIQALENLPDFPGLF